MCSSDLRSYADEDDDVYIYERQDEEKIIRIFLNFSDRDQIIDAGLEKDAQVLLCSDREHIKGRLKPLEALILLKKIQDTTWL